MKRVRAAAMAVTVIGLCAASYLGGAMSAQGAAKAPAAKVTMSSVHGNGTGVVDRLYILDGGIGRTNDAGAWLNMLMPPNTPIDIGAPAHLIKHGNDWMLFDTSTNDGYAKLSDYGGNGIRWLKKESQTLPPQLKAVGITADDIKYIGISHNHPDHTGNIEQFKKAEVLIQKREYDFMFANGATGPNGAPAYPGPVMEKDHPHKLLDGDYDVFGDGSVILFFTAGHTLGSQVCLVHLKSGYILLSGDAVHLRSNFDTRRIPRVGTANDENQWLWSVPIAFARVDALMKFYKAQLWVHHDMDDYKGKKYAPQYYE